MQRSRSISEIARARAVGQRACVHAMPGRCAGDNADCAYREAVALVLAQDAANTAYKVQPLHFSPAG